MKHPTYLERRFSSGISNATNKLFMSSCADTESSFPPEYEEDDLKSFFPPFF